jgi:hypothetical protein
MIKPWPYLYETHSLLHLANTGRLSASNRTTARTTTIVVHDPLTSIADGDVLECSITPVFSGRVACLLDGQVDWDSYSGGADQKDDESGSEGEDLHCC